MQIQIITTHQELQETLDLAVKNALKDKAVNDSTDLIEIIDTKELCKRLGITEPTVIRWRQKGKIPYLQIGSAVRFDFRAVIKALEISKRKGNKG